MTMYHMHCISISLYLVVHQPSKEIGWPDYEQSFPKLGTVPGGRRRQVMQQDVRHSGHRSDLPMRKAMRKVSLDTYFFILIASTMGAI